MKLNCGLPRNVRRKLRREKISEWHVWFAWFPVRVGLQDCRWLEKIERKASFWYGEFCKWNYRAIEENKEDVTT